VVYRRSAFIIVGLGLIQFLSRYFPAQLNPVLDTLAKIPDTIIGTGVRKEYVFLLLAVILALAFLYFGMSAVTYYFELGIITDYLWGVDEEWVNGLIAFMCGYYGYLCFRIYLFSEWEDVS